MLLTAGRARDRIENRSRANFKGGPLAADPDDLAELTPAFTIVGGRATHDPDKRLARVGE